jgi:hypothetical protein
MKNDKKTIWKNLFESMDLFYTILEGSARNGLSLGWAEPAKGSALLWQSNRKIFFGGPN